MFGSNVLEVATGLVFIYLALSLACSALFELFASFFQLRANNLSRALHNMLGEKHYAEVSQSPLLLSLALPGRRPSYLDAATFARVVQSSGKSGAELKAWIEAMPEGRGREVMLALAEQSGYDPVQLRTEMEVWFNQTMARASGWYKRNAQKWLMGLALLFCLALNVDTLMIIDTLWKDPQLRGQLVMAAEQARAQMEAPTKPTTEIAPEQVKEKAEEAIAKAKAAAAMIKGIPFPLGWKGETQGLPGDAMGWLLKVLGIIISVLAIAQGAPFWFDLLNKLSNLRGSGRPLSAK